MTTETVVGTLSAEDIAALRMARSVAFHHYQGRAFIRAYMDASGDPATFTRREQILFPETAEMSRERCREIAVSGSIAGYTGNASMWHVDRDDTRALAFYMIHAAQFALTWVTVASLLTPGESLSLHWIADNNTETLTDAGLHSDRVQLTATKGKRVRTFDVGYQVTHDNSARMIRRYGN